MASPHTNWSEIADDYINTNWGTGDGRSPTEIIKGLSEQKMMLILIRDIATSLRILRCGGFQDIPRRLQQIIDNTNRIPKSRRGRKKAKTP